MWKVESNGSGFVLFERIECEECEGYGYIDDDSAEPPECSVCGGDGMAWVILADGPNDVGYGWRTLSAARDHAVKVLGLDPTKEAR